MSAKNIWRALGAAGALLLGANSALAQPSFEGKSKEQIFLEAWETGSTINKERGRIYLAEKYPDSAEGVFSRAWLAGINGNKASEIELYLECLANDPLFVWCLSNLAFNLDARSDPSGFSKALRLFDAMGDKRYEAVALENLFMAHVDAGDRSAAIAFLENHVESLAAIGASWRESFLRGRLAYSERDYDAAIAFFEQSIELGADGFGPVRWLADSIQNTHTPAKLQRDRNLRQQVLLPLARYAQQNPDDGAVHAYFARFQKAMGQRRAVSGSYMEAFQRDPQPEYAESARKESFDPKASKAFMESAIDRLPDDPAIASELGFFKIFFELDIAEGRRILDSSLAAIKSDRLKRIKARDYAFFLERHAWDWDYAFDLRQRYDADIEEASRQLMVNRFRAGDFEQARKYLDIAEASGTSNATYLESYRGRIERAEADRKAIDEAAPYLTFLDQWSGASVRNTGSAEKRVTFERGLAGLSPAARRDLGDMAKLLRQGADTVDVIEVAGFAEPDESDAAEALALDRAAAVRTALVEMSGLPVERFALVSTTAPTMVAGSAGGMRATVTPLADYGEQSIVAPVGRADYTVSLSPNGRFALIGQSPRVFDLATGRVRSQLGRGINPLFSPNGRLIAMKSAWTEQGGHKSRGLYIYDSVTGHRVDAIEFNSEELDSGSYTWSPDSSAIAFVTDTGQIMRYDLASRRQVWVTRVFDRYTGARIAWSPDGDTIAIGHSMADFIALIDSETGNQVKRLKGGTWSRAMAWAPDGRSLYSADNTLNLFKWDVQTGRRSQMQIPHHPNRLMTLDPTGRFAMLDIGLRASDSDNTRQIVKLDLENMTVAGSIPMDNQNFAVSHDAAHVLLGRDEVQIWRSGDLALADILPLPATGLDFSIRPKNCGCFVTKDADGVHVWDAGTGRQRHSFSEDAEALVTLTDGSAMVGLVGDQLMRFSLVDFTVEGWGTALTAGGVAQKLSIDNGLLVVGGVVSLRTDRAVAEVRRLNDRSLVKRITFPVVTEARQYRGTYRAKITDIRIDAERRQIIATTSWKEHLKYATKQSREARVFNIDDGRLAFKVRPNRDINSARFDSWKGQDAVVVRSGAFANVYDSVGAFVEQVSIGEDGRSYERNGRKFTTVRVGTRTILVDWLEGEPAIRIDGGDNLMGYHVLPDLNLLVATRYDNSFTFHNLETGELALTIAALRNSEWLAYTPAGLYAASVNGADHASLAFGSVVRPLEAYDRSLESREFVAETLASQSSGRTIKALADAEVRARSSAYTAPFLLSAVSKLPGRVSSETINVEYKLDAASDTDADPLIEFWVNGRVLPPENVAEKVAADGTFTRAFDLVPGRNTILAQVLYRGARFDQVSVTVDNVIDPDGPAMRRAAKPKLFFLGVGISDYQEADADLKFADKDVTEVAKLLEKQKGVVFSDVQKLLLTNEDAKKDDIEELGIYEFLDYASPNDVIVIYLAGHGAQHRNGELFLMTHESDFDRPFTGFKMKIFADFLKNRPQSQKAILFMDMCRAGTLQFFDSGARNTALGGASQVTAEDVAVELDGSGTIIFSASTGAAPAYEASDYGAGGHGAFTAAVLEALRGQADGLIGGTGADANGFVDVKELESYVVERVPELTGAKNQQPKILAAFNVEPYALTEAE